MPAASKPAKQPFDAVSSLVHAYAISERINQYVLENLSEQAWNAAPPEGSGRTIAAIFAHIHNVRLMWLKATEKDAPPLPAKLEKSSITIAETRAALAESYQRIAKVIRNGLETGTVRGFKPDAGAFLGYSIAHEAHHRGQVMSLARRVGHALPQAVQFGMWEWGSRSKEITPD